MKTNREACIRTMVVLLAFCAVAMALGMLPARINDGPRRPTLVPETIHERAADESMLRIIGHHLPFTISVGETSPDCASALDVELVVRSDNDGRITDVRWRVMDRGSVQLECVDFYDLYYRCEAPSCLNVQIHKEPLSGTPVTERTVHVCMD